MARHFRCNACGRCCHGQLPLIWKDALANASRFPLCLVWTPVRQGSKDYALVATLGTTIRLPDRRELAVLIVPTSYLPSAFPCPALGDDHRCTIHERKPSRCRTMPFYPYREERYQAELLAPRSGWECDTSTSAPVVYEGEQIVERADFDRERQDLLEQVPLLRRYAEYMVKYSPSLVTSLVVASSKSQVNHVITSLSSFLTGTRNPDSKHIAGLQLPILRDYAARTGGDPRLVAFHKDYANWSKEMAYLSQLTSPRNCP